jgi:hypothetical protein
MTTIKITALISPIFTLSVFVLTGSSSIPGIPGALRDIEDIVGCKKGLITEVVTVEGKMCMVCEVVVGKP